MFDPQHWAEDTEYIDTHEDIPTKPDKRPKYKGYTLKREYCKSIGITIKVFNETLVDEGIIHWHLISRDLIGNNHNYGYGIKDHKPMVAKPYRGTWQAGYYQYKISKLNDIFARTLSLIEL